LPRVIVGRSENDSVQLVRITPVAANETLYSIKLLGITSQYTSDSSATVAEITAGLKAAIETNQSLSSITITDSGTHLDLQGVDTLVRFSVSVNSYTLLQQLDLTADAGGANGIAADLTAIKEQTDEWYVLNPTNLGKDVQIAAAAWTETQKKIMLSSTADYDVLDPNEQVNDLFSKLSIYARTAMQWSHVSGEKFLGAGWGGTVLPYTPGKATWKFKTLNGTETTPLSDTDKATIEAKGGNWYVTEAGSGHHWPGKSHGWGVYRCGSWSGLDRGQNSRGRFRAAGHPAEDSLYGSRGGSRSGKGSGRARSGRHKRALHRQPRTGHHGSSYIFDSRRDQSYQIVTGC